MICADCGKDTHALLSGLWCPECCDGVYDWWDSSDDDDQCEFCGKPDRRCECTPALYAEEVIR